MEGYMCSMRLVESRANNVAVIGGRPYTLDPLQNG